MYSSHAGVAPSPQLLRQINRRQREEKETFSSDAQVRMCHRRRHEQQQQHSDGWHHFHLQLSCCFIPNNRERCRKVDHPPVCRTSFNVLELPVLVIVTTDMCLHYTYHLRGRVWVMTSLTSSCAGSLHQKTNCLAPYSSRSMSCDRAEHALRLGTLTWGGMS